MMATRVSWRFAEITNSLDIDYLLNTGNKYLCYKGEQVSGRWVPCVGLGASALTLDSFTTGTKLTLAVGGATILIHRATRNHPHNLGERLRATIHRISAGSRNLIHKPSEADIIDQPQRQKIRPDTGPARGHERQRNTS